MSKPRKTGWKRPDCKPQWRINPDPDLKRRLLEFEVVCRHRFRRRGATVGGANCRGFALRSIGDKLFRLSPTQILYCQGRAKNFFAEVEERTAMRARKHKPIDSDAAIAALEARKAA